MDNKNKGDMLDEFWDLSSYAPPKKTAAKDPETVSTASIEIPAKAYSQGDSKQRDTVIKRYIDPMHYENKRIKKEAIESVEEYVPESGLLHKVTLKKLKSSYNLYADFATCAKRYKSASGSEAEYVPYYSYVPQYDQLSSAQLF